MSPFIRNGNTICLKLIRMKDRIRIGDIVAVRQKNPDKIFIHRVIGIKEKKIQVKGDNRKVPDGWFPVHSIIGIVTKIKNTYGNIAVKIPLINPVIAFLSRTGILYRVLLPLARWTKQGIKNRVVNG
ncbi:MAG: hypothetical protein MI862_04140 [Desulfobacterales bacterium]|nr:hypothetical protein [Desulfobacterales bacterium]